MVENGEGMLSVLQYFYPDYVIASSDGGYHFFPILENLKKNNFDLDKFTYPVYNEEIKEWEGTASYMAGTENEAKKGVDVSTYQGDIDWEKLSQTRQSQFPIRFIYMKATEGGEFIDEHFKANFDSARVHGFIRGAYHFYNPKTDAIRQADFFINSVKLEPGDLPPVLDIEKKAKDMNRFRADLKLWLQLVEKHYGVKPIIYASYKFKTNYLNDSVFNSYPYWIAHYYVDSVRYQGDWDFWQHHDAGTLPGIDEQVDLNIFNGSLQQLDSLCIKE